VNRQSGSLVLGWDCSKDGVLSFTILRLRDPAQALILMSLLSECTERVRKNLYPSFDFKSTRADFLSQVPRPNEYGDEWKDRGHGLAHGVAEFSHNNFHLPRTRLESAGLLLSSTQWPGPDIERIPYLSADLALTFDELSAFFSRVTPPLHPSP
jgi:hypothetical protein